MKKVPSALVEHPLPDQLRTALTDLAKAHGLDVGVFNCSAMANGGIALYAEINPVKQAAPPPVAEQKPVLIGEDDPSPVLPVHAQRIADYLNGLYFTPIKLVADGAKAGQLVLQLAADNPGMIGFRAMSDGTTFIGHLIGQVRAGHEHALTPVSSSVHEVTTVWLPSSIRGQRPAKDDTVWFKKQPDAKQLNHGSVFDFEPGYVFIRIGIESFKVPADDCWTQVKPVQEATTSTQPRLPSKRDKMKSRKPGQK